MMNEWRCYLRHDLSGTGVWAEGETRLRALELAQAMYMDCFQDDLPKPQYVHTAHGPEAVPRG